MADQERNIKKCHSNYLLALMFCFWLGAVKGADFDGFRSINLGSEMYLRKQLHLWSLQVPLSPFILLSAEILKGLNESEDLRRPNSDRFW